MPRPAFARLAAVAAALAGCNGSSVSSVPDDYVRALAVVDERISSRQAVAVPRTARAGEPFDVEVTAVLTWGCDEFVDGNVAVDGLVATISPYVSTPTSGVCSNRASVESRTYAVRFERAGAATVRVRARSPEGRGEEIVIERQVAVAP